METHFRGIYMVFFWFLSGLDLYCGRDDENYMGSLAPSEYLRTPPRYQTPT